MWQITRVDKYGRVWQGASQATYRDGERAARSRIDSCSISSWRWLASERGEVGRKWWRGDSGDGTKASAPRSRRWVSRSRSASEALLRADPLTYEPVMSISVGLRGELGAVRVERSSRAPLAKLRWLARGVEGVELMLVSMYTTGCGYICTSRGCGWLVKVGLSQARWRWQETRGDAHRCGILRGDRTDRWVDG